MKKSLLTIIILLITFTPSFAAEESFMKTDENKDGKISQQEYKAAASRSFDQLDKNKDGILSKKEIAAHDKIDAEKFINVINPGKEGKIVKKMYMQAAEEQFKTMDKNQDGYINMKEWSIFRSKPKQPMLVIFTF